MRQVAYVHLEKGLLRHLADIEKEADPLQRFRDLIGSKGSDADGKQLGQAIVFLNRPDITELDTKLRKDAETAGQKFVGMNLPSAFIEFFETSTYHSLLKYSPPLGD